MSAPILKKIRSAGARIKSRLSRRALVLLYHRIAETDSDPWQLAVTPQHFAEHLQVLSEYNRSMPLQKLSAAMRNGTLPRRAVTVTFDDGYVDNLLNAKPLLEKHDVPATVFITTGYTGMNREFWWDELDRLFLQPGQLPDTLRLSVNGNNYNWELGEAAEYPETFYHRNRRWRAWQEDDPTARQSVYRSLWQLMHPMAESERQPLREELLVWAGAASSARQTHRALSREEIRELARGGLIEVGCHTVTHPQLSALSRASQWNELRQSKSDLEEILGNPVSSFAYPYGQKRDYTGETVELVRKAGFDCACTTSVGVVERRADRFQLPRAQVQDMDGESFGRFLSECVGD
ncbi:MAG TPA: polysaccharide deacetylase family protein [Blastocatellia bacterium]|nr:polysaccharide deacetylase family protein [Blastocatellia bacterium]